MLRRAADRMSAVLLTLPPIARALETAAAGTARIADASAGLTRAIVAERPPVAPRVAGTARIAEASAELTPATGAHSLRVARTAGTAWLVVGTAAHTLVCLANGVGAGTAAAVHGAATAVGGVAAAGPGATGGGAATDAGDTGGPAAAGLSGPEISTGDAVVTAGPAGLILRSQLARRAIAAATACADRRRAGAIALTGATAATAAATGTPAIGLTDLPRLPAVIPLLRLIDDAGAGRRIAHEARVAQRIARARATVNAGAAGIDDRGTFAGAGLGCRLRHAAGLLAGPLLLSLPLALALAVVLVVAGIMAIPGFAPMPPMRAAPLRVPLGGRLRPVPEERGQRASQWQGGNEAQQSAPGVARRDRPDDGLASFTVPSRPGTRLPSERRHPAGTG